MSRKERKLAAVTAAAAYGVRDDENVGIGRGAGRGFGEVPDDGGVCVEEIFDSGQLCLLFPSLCD